MPAMLFFSPYSWDFGRLYLIHLLIRDQWIVCGQPDPTHFLCGWVYVCLCWLWNGKRCQDSFDVVGATGSLQSRPLYGARLISLLTYTHTHILSSLHSVPYSQVECVFSYHAAQGLLNTFAPAISTTHQFKSSKKPMGKNEHCWDVNKDSLSLACV